MPPPMPSPSAQDELEKLTLQGHGPFIPERRIGNQIETPAPVLDELVWLHFGRTEMELARAGPFVDIQWVSEGELMVSGVAKLLWPHEYTSGISSQLMTFGELVTAVNGWTHKEADHSELSRVMDSFKAEVLKKWRADWALYHSVHVQRLGYIRSGDGFARLREVKYDGESVHYTAEFLKFQPSGHCLPVPLDWTINSIEVIEKDLALWTRHPSVTPLQLSTEYFMREPRMIKTLSPGEPSPCWTKGGAQKPPENVALDCVLPVFIDQSRTGPSE